MKASALAIAAAAIGTNAAAADPIAPSEVPFDEYGSVARPLTKTEGDPANGAKLVGTKGAGNCIACHQVSDLSEIPWHGTVGPSLDGVADRWTEADLRGIVADAKQVFPGTIMPSFYKASGYVRPGRAFTGDAIPPEEIEPLLTAQQVEDVVAYLMTLREG